MSRLLLIAAATCCLMGCRGTCGNTCSLFNRCNSQQAVPVSYGAPVTTAPASYSLAGRPVTAMPVSNVPLIPPPPANAVELPYPTETILPTGPLSGVPNPARSVSGQK